MCLYKQITLLLIGVLFLSLIALLIADYAIVFSVFILIAGVILLVFGFYLQSKVFSNRRICLSVLILLTNMISVFLILYNVFVPLAIIDSKMVSMQCCSKMTKIGQALSIYADANGGFYPDLNGDAGLNQLLANSKLEIKDLECPAHDKLWFKILRLFNGESMYSSEQYRYVGGLSKNTTPPEILLFENEWETHLSTRVYMLSNLVICSTYNLKLKKAKVLRLFQLKNSEGIMLPQIFQNYQYGYYWMEWGPRIEKVNNNIDSR